MKNAIRYWQTVFRNCNLHLAGHTVHSLGDSFVCIQTEELEAFLFGGSDAALDLFGKEQEEGMDGTFFKTAADCSPGIVSLQPGTAS